MYLFVLHQTLLGALTLLGAQVSGVRLHVTSQSIKLLPCGKIQAKTSNRLSALTAIVLLLLCLRLYRHG